MVKAKSRKGGTKKGSKHLTKADKDKICGAWSTDLSIEEIYRTNILSSKAHDIFISTMIICRPTIAALDLARPDPGHSSTESYIRYMHTFIRSFICCLTFVLSIFTTQIPWKLYMMTEAQPSTWRRDLRNSPCNKGWQLSCSTHSDHFYRYYDIPRVSIWTYFYLKTLKCKLLFVNKKGDFEENLACPLTPSILLIRKSCRWKVYAFQ